MILTPESPLWIDFTEELFGPDKLNLQLSGKITCHNDTRFSKAILEKMKGVDVEKTLKYFEEHGGFCDCEIIYNIEMKKP